MAEFPFFNSSMTDYPGLNGLDGQSYRDTFDYSQYGSPAKLRLLSVPWRSDYRDTVRFESEAARDAWFSRQSPEIVEYSTPWLRIPTQSVNIPLPYDKAAYFNYLYLDIPTRPIDNGDEPARLFYFITGIRYAAPSTTVLELELDVWQTYGYRMSVESLYLERGHAPMYRADLDSYLSNPCGNSRYLLAKDVDFSNGSERIAAVEHYPIGSGTKWLVIALPLTVSDFAALNLASAGASTPPVYSDTGARNGYQLDVSGYAWANDGYSYPDSELPVTPARSSDGRTLDGTNLFAVEFPDATSALVNLCLYAPHVVAAASYIAVVPEILVEPAQSEPVTVAGYPWTVIKANPQVELEPYNLTRENIGLPSYASDIAKAYTWPYTRLMVQDQEGRGFEVRIEDIAGNALEFNADVSLASASLIFNIEASNIGTSDSLTIAWRTLEGSEQSTIFGSDIAAHAIEWGIPTYDVQLSAADLEAVQRWHDLEAQRQAALNAYKQAVRGANTALANTQAANATSVSNTQNSGNTATANQTIANNRDNAIAAQNVATNTTLGALSHQQAYDLSAADDEFQSYAVDVAALSNAMSAANNAVGALASGNVMGAMSTGFSAALSITSNQAMADLSVTALLAKQGATVGYIDATTTAHNTNTTNNNATAVTAATDINTNNVNLANTNAANSAAMSNGNAGYSRADAVTAAKENLEQTRRAALASFRAAATRAAKVGAISGDNSLDALNRRAFSVKTVCQDDYALRAACGYFMRYGYALAAPIRFDSWLEQGEYCYWKGSHAIIKGNVPDLYRNALEGILEQGTTVWATPEKVGDYATD